MTITAGTELVDSAYYAKHGPPHDIWTRLLAESPVHRCEPEGYQPFWAITKYDDINAISTQPNRFVNSGGITVLKPADDAALNASALTAMRTIITMDPPEHRDVRGIAAHLFTPRGISALDDEIERSAREIVDQMAGDSGEGECDFATDVAVAHPLRILANMLGIPRSREPDILRITNQLFGFEDPDLQRDTDRSRGLAEVAMEAYTMFDAIIQDRRGCPREDLASALANACVHGEQLGMMETMGYYLIVFSAGHDTTKNALVGGMRAFIENPGEVAKLQRDPALIDWAVEEVVRWSSPVNYMKRTSAEDTEIRGQRIAAGDALVLFYASANRDEDIFEDPFTFRVDRPVKKRNLGFGVGEHFCLGAYLARRSQRALWTELLSRLESVELAGEPLQIQSSFVVGLKHLPIRYRIRPAAS